MSDGTCPARQELKHAGNIPWRSHPLGGKIVASIFQSLTRWEKEI